MSVRCLLESLAVRIRVQICAATGMLVGQLLGLLATGIATAGSPAGDPQRGYQLLTEKAYLPGDFDQATFDQVWQVWPKELRQQAEKATNEERRRMAFERYGLTEKDSTGKPLQYVVDSQGLWTMNCFSCHGGSVYGESYPGAPNNRFALQTLTEEIRAAKFRLGKTLTRMDLGAYVIPLGATVGRTNAVMFGVGLMHFRNPDLSLHDPNVPPPMMHHDMDAPPWWHFHRKPYLYIDGFAPRGHRGLMQFMLVKENGPEKFRQWESDFRDVYAYLMSLRAPKYEGAVDWDLARRGQALFNDTCSRCHGTYGDLRGRRDEDVDYPSIVVPLEEIGTDPVRWRALPVAGRTRYAESWFADGDDARSVPTVVEPEGYLAPPLDGVWASPPYLHNGSLPTLWHVLNPASRPAVWRRVGKGMDERHVGFEIETVDRIPLTVRDIGQRREYFDTRAFGNSAEGHDFGLELTEAERWSVLEYLKTL